MQPAVTFFIHASRQTGSRIPGLRRTDGAGQLRLRRGRDAGLVVVCQTRSPSTVPFEVLSVDRRAANRADGAGAAATRPPTPGTPRSLNSSGYGGRPGPEVGAGAGRGERPAKKGEHVQLFCGRAQPARLPLVSRRYVRAPARCTGAGPQRGACCDGNLAPLRVVRLFRLANRQPIGSAFWL